MKNRNVEFFNLSFLDLLSGALAAIIFLFIIVPKGEITLRDEPVTVVYDTIQNRFYGSIPAGFHARGDGDTILAIIGNLEGVPIAMADPQTPEETPEEPVRQRTRRTQESPASEARTEEKPRREEESMQVTTSTAAPAELNGSRPNVPCMLSFEIRWANKMDNVDLYVCKDNACVFGGKRHLPFIGFWDSGKSKTRLFGGDLRTNQEAVRQFDQIIPGTYDIYVQYKESTEPKADIPIRLQVYTKNAEDQERGDDHYFKLPMDPINKTRVAQVVVGPNGEIEFKTFK